MDLFNFYFDWQSSERMFGAFFGVFEPSSLQGYVCNAGPSGFSHSDITDLLARLGVDGFEPDSDINLIDDDPSAESSSDALSPTKPTWVPMPD